MCQLFHAVVVVVIFLQSSPSSPEPASLPAEDLSTNSNGPKPAEMIDDDREDLFAGNYFFSSDVSV